MSMVNERAEQYKNDKYAHFPDALNSNTPNNSW